MSNGKKQFEKLNTVLQYANEWDISQLQLEYVNDVKPGIPSDKNGVNIKIRTLNKDGSKGKLLFKIERSPSFGVSTKFGATLGVKLYDGYPSDYQARTIEVFEQITEKAKAFVYENRKDMKKPKLTPDDSLFKTLNPLRYKEDENGDRMANMAPLMNLKFSSKKDATGQETVTTRFTLEDEVDENGNAVEIDWHDLVDRRCFVTCVVRVDSIFVGQMIVLRCYLDECDLKLMETSGKMHYLRPTGVAATRINLNGEDDISKKHTSEPVPVFAADDSSRKTITYESESESDHEEEEPPKAEPVSKKPVAKKALAKK